MTVQWRFIRKQLAASAAPAVASGASSPVIESPVIESPAADSPAVESPVVEASLIEPAKAEAQPILDELSISEPLAPPIEIEPVPPPIASELPKVAEPTVAIDAAFMEEPPIAAEISPAKEPAPATADIAEEPPLGDEDDPAAPLPQIQIDVRRASYLEDQPEAPESWFRRYISFTGSLAFHLVAMIILAACLGKYLPQVITPDLFYATDYPEMTQTIELSPVMTAMSSGSEENADTEVAESLDVTNTAEVAPPLEETVSFEYAPEMSLGSPGLPTNIPNAIAGFGSNPESRTSMLAPLRGNGPSGAGGGGGSGGIGADLGVLRQFTQRLSRAGAKGGDVQISLIWDNYNDLDLHVITPRGENIFFGHRSSRCRGELDVDMNAGGPVTQEPVENIYWGKGKAPNGKFRVAVHHYRNHGDPDPTKYELRIVVDGETKVINGEISFGSPRMIVYEFERGGNKPTPAKPSGPSRYSPAKNSNDALILNSPLPEAE